MPHTAREPNNPIIQLATLLVKDVPNLSVHFPESTMAESINDLAAMLFQASAQVTPIPADDYAFLKQSIFN